MRFVYVNWCVCVCSFNNRLKAEEENRLGLDRSSNQYHWDYSVVGASPPDGQPLSRSPATTVGDNWTANRSNSNSNRINRILKKKKTYRSRGQAALSEAPQPRKLTTSSAIDWHLCALQTLTLEPLTAERTSLGFLCLFSFSFFFFSRKDK